LRAGFDKTDPNTTVSNEEMTTKTKIGKKDPSPATVGSDGPIGTSSIA